MKYHILLHSCKEAVGMPFKMPLSSCLCLGYALIPSAKSENFSDSSHSEISSRSSIVSNCSADSMSAALQDERCLPQTVVVVDSGGTEDRKEYPQPSSEFSQPCTR